MFLVFIVYFGFYFYYFISLFMMFNVDFFVVNIIIVVGVWVWWVFSGKLGWIWKVNGF